MRMLSFGVMLKCATGCSIIEIVRLDVDTQIPDVGVKTYVVVT